MKLIFEQSHPGHKSQFLPAVIGGSCGAAALLAAVIIIAVVIKKKKSKAK